MKNRKLKTFIAFLAFGVPGTVLCATQFEVATNGDDSNAGTAAAPFHTIQRAADVAMPGDIINVHAGVYRERVNPPRGGTSDRKRITYQAAPGDTVEIKGSEIVANWNWVREDAWRAVIPNTFFGSFNPYSDVIRADWYSPNGREYHTGAVYVNGEMLLEATNLNKILQQAGPNVSWFGRVDATNTTIWAQFPGTDPNEGQVEINVRQTVFTPVKTGVNYLTVRGFTLSQAATPWAPPTAGQIGLITAYWCKGWIIEDNTISYSRCCGVALGKYSDEWDNATTRSRTDSSIPAEYRDGYLAYCQTIARALTNGWNRETVGGHLVRNNAISHCGQTGIVGSLGCSFSTVSDNVIHDIDYPQRFFGAEMAGIKLHAAIDVIVSHNHIYRCGGSGGLWFDWMAQGARISGNLFHDNPGQDLYFEVDHGPILVDNNVLLSQHTMNDDSQGVAFVHNLIAGTLHHGQGERRLTPYFKPHSTKNILYSGILSGDDRFYNNLMLLPAGLISYDSANLPVSMDGNVFLAGAQPSKWEKEPLTPPDFNPAFQIEEKPDGWYLAIHLDPAWRAECRSRLVTTRLLGKTLITHERFENRDGSSLKINTDYFSEKRDTKNPFPGPFDKVKAGLQEIKIWPLTTVSAR